ncbi:MAG: nicotinate (nicotinamide) nucleotide adenylyltransferase [Deltaproteobacteria bacterium RIFCSPLOWO2_02_FULL_53_8]|nr:MAG: nicotinate (nicotinamide) nucleotide adenylyltransferase [Deltaproteobacteria bacterium RIFCSPLOWO2_02_FULL_53_8]
MHIGIMGGTFDPIHYGHLRCAQEALEGFELDKVVFVPTAVTPHKPEDGMTPAAARLEMVRLAISDNPGFEVSDIEIKRGGRSFTIDTVRELSGQGVEISLIVGNDSFNDISTWCEYETLFTLVNFIIVARPDYPPKKPAEALPVALARNFWYDAALECYKSSWDKTLTYAGTTLFAISSTDIRRRVSTGRSIRYLTPRSVADYIVTEELYK